MKKILLAILIAGSLTACKVTFTSSVRSTIEAKELDLKKIQYYNSQKIILRRILTSEEAGIASGKVSIQNGLRIEEIQIKKNTPGVCDKILDRELHIRFEENKGQYLVFKQGPYGDYRLESDWTTKNDYKSGSSEYTFFNTYKGQVQYGDEIYYISTSTLPKLKIKKSESSSVSKQTRVATGVKVE